MTKDTMIEELGKKLTASIIKCKRLQKEKRELEDKAECGRAHIQSGTTFAPGHRAYGTTADMEKLRELLDNIK